MVKIYLEGGAQDSMLDRSLCRQAFSKFFSTAGLKGKLPRTVPCGGRKAAYDAFVTAVSNPRPGELPLLLVDSEAPVQIGRTVWEHLKSRPGDNWDKPMGASDDQAFLMVQVMETWFIADREALKEFFGKGFRDDVIPTWPNLEQVPKLTVYNILEQATAQCATRQYNEGNIAFALLAQISPSKVEAASPHAKRLLERLRNL